MHEPEFIEGRLADRMNAETADREAKHSRWHYRLLFDENVGWDWIEKQVEDVSSDIGVRLEPYKIGPDREHTAIVVEVRELQRREGIDDLQNSLDQFS